MAKTILVKLKKAGSRLTKFTISDNYGNTLAKEVSKSLLIDGIAFSIDDAVTVITLTSTGKGCCSKSWNIPVSTMTLQEIVDTKFVTTNTASLWRHLTDTTVYNKYYGCVYPYIIEYPFAYESQEQIIQSIEDYTKAYKYYPSVNGVFDNSRKVQTDNAYFNKAVLYNDQQSSGVLELVAKPVNSLKEYLKYPIFNADSKIITYTKSASYYQYNTFWSVVKDKTIPLFTTSCESLSLDKEVNQDNMVYTHRAFKKEPLRAMDLKVRHILDNSSETHLVSQFIIAPSQISYK